MMETSGVMLLDDELVADRCGQRVDVIGDILGRQLRIGFEGRFLVLA